VRNLILEIILKIDIDFAWSTQKHGVCPAILMKTIYNTHLTARQIKRLKKIGAGSFGNVYVSEWHGMKVCEKVQHSKSGIITNEERRNYIRESGVMLHCSNHINIVKYIGLVLREVDATEDNAGSRIKYAIVSEYHPRGSLDKILYGGNKIQIDIRRKVLMILDTARGLSHLHDDMISIIHRDLATRNLLVSSDWTIKITDFGLSRFLKKKVDQVSNIDTAAEVDREKTVKRPRRLTQNDTKNFIGPVKWMAPEAIMEQKYSRASDVYMFGTTAWEIFYESEPYKDKEAMSVGISVVKDKLRPDITFPPSPIRPPRNRPFSKENDWKILTEMMERCWAEKPQSRPTISEVLTTLNEKCKSVFQKYRESLHEEMVSSRSWAKLQQDSLSPNKLLKPPLEFDTKLSVSEEDEIKSLSQSPSVQVCEQQRRYSKPMGTESHYSWTNGTTNETLSAIHEKGPMRMNTLKNLESSYTNDESCSSAEVFYEQPEVSGLLL